ncbi:hypothetical protein AMEJIAPC_03978 [Caulobacter sp. NIBR1757]|nr:hypothetical protein AMEJIAPC_03978 [Caulobacter sp. NIBR1757]
MSGAERALALAIGQAYAAFADVGAPRRLDAPPHRKPEELLQRLTGAPLAELSEDQLGPYAGWAMTTVGDARAYQHFLPRILELATGPNSHMGFDPPVLAGKLVYGEWSGWRRDRREAVLAVFGAAFAAALTEPYAANGPGEWLAGLARLTQVTPFLEQWRASADPWAAIHLAVLRVSWMDSLTDEDGQPPFRDDVDIGISAEVEAWLLSAESRRQIERALAAAPEEERWQLERALPDQ